MLRNDLFKNKSVLVTGGTGSFGKKITAKLLKEHSPKKVIIYSRDELKQFEMRHMPEFKDVERLRYFIGDVRDYPRLKMAFHGVDYVIHAAALKQVPACEYNPFEAVKTNVLGAENIITAAIENNVKKVIALSTDKAANPVNLYGATKLCSDKLFISGNAYAAGEITRFSVVRYGNVVGSRGSVIPLFKKLKNTGALPITDERMTRFWITLNQTADFVIKCFDRMCGGELFVPKIPSMKIVDLAKAIVPGCKFEYIGIRPGEKLHEILITRDDARRTVDTKDMYVVEPDFEWWGNIESHVQGKKVSEDFVYSSDTNPEWLTVKELKSMVEE
ncbi:MAG: UDP-N-acetylglucosamine 4,6-dehydratase (inverting) [Candidatus Aureabacteria bacterium]|nr:UDP-N-acetylglucosamine 4,6-dehydratase (inverting) [Candidatus Auribacterota bacterium]